MNEKELLLKTLKYSINPDAFAEKSSGGGTEYSDVVGTVGSSSGGAESARVFDSEALRGVDWRRLYELADSQQVVGMVYDALRGCIPAEYVKLFKMRFSLELYSYMQRQSLNKDIRGAFEAAGVPYYFVKGDVISRFYPKPMLRTMGDSDIIVHSADMARVDDILVGMGCKDETGASGMERKYTKNRMLWELHRELCYEEDLGNNDAMSQYFADHWDNVRDNRLEWNYHFLYMLAHLRKHIVNAGAGFRQFMDIAVAVKYSQLDYEWIEAEAGKLGLTDFLHTVYALNYRWWGIRPGVAVAAAPGAAEGFTCSAAADAGSAASGAAYVPKFADVDDDFYAEATESIFRGGVFGFDDEENHNTRVAAQIVRGGTDYRKGRAAWLLSRIFPSYDELRGCYYLGYLEGRPALLPVAWVHRAIKRIPERGRVANVTKEAAVDRGTVEARVEKLRRWGL